MRSAAALVVLLCLLATGCAGDEGGAEPVVKSSCAAPLFEVEGEPDLIVVSDLPRGGIGKRTTEVMIDAMEFVLRGRDFRAGDWRVAYQSCNDTVGDLPFDPALCRQNARAYVETEHVVGIVGPWNSGCAWEQIPVVSRREAGPLALVSPSNTYHALTRGPETASLYPDDVRSYFRVVTHDLAQGAAAAHLAQKLGARRVALVRQDHSDEYIRALSTSFSAAARALGLQARTFLWEAQDSYAALARAVAATRPEAVYLAGLTQLNAKALVEDLRTALPATVPLLTPDSFAADDVAQELGPAGDGLYATVPGIPAEALPAAGQRFVREFNRPSPGAPGQLGAPEAAQAMEVLLDAIARSDGTRASVVEELFASNVVDGILGSFRFDRNGDIDPAPVGVYRFRNGRVVGGEYITVPLGRT